MTNCKRMGLGFLLAMAMILVLGSGAQGQSISAGFEPYDDFEADVIDPMRWSTHLSPTKSLYEVTRDIDRRRFQAGVRIYGRANTMTSLSAASNILEMQPTAIPIMGVQFDAHMLDYEVIGCEAPEAEPAKALMGYLGTLFYDGTLREEGSVAGNVFALLRIFRENISTNNNNRVLTVEGVVFRCISATCGDREDIGVVSLGEAQLRRWQTYSVTWEPENNQVLFQVGDEAPQAVSYPQQVVGVVGTHVLLTRVEVPNCADEPRPVAGVLGLYDNVLVK